MEFVQEDEVSRTANLFPASSREHMFDKVVTPSDVGKLNRLVIPKQHAERYFPLDSSTTDKGLLLNFEDSSGKPWRFRYSYWNSSQSYVMTKGWSRFVKDKTLHAGDVVSFHRHLSTDRLFIDWRRRPQPPLNSHLRLGYNNFHYHNYNNTPHRHPSELPVYYLRPLEQSRQVLESVPLLHGGGKRLRLFGVNMECEMKREEVHDQPPPLSVKGKSSLSFDLDL